MHHPPSGVTPSDRLQVVNILNGILNRKCIPPHFHSFQHSSTNSPAAEYYTSQSEYLLKRAKHYESICYKRATNNLDYYTFVNEGIYKIAVTYKNQHGKPGTRLLPKQSARAGAPGTPVTPVVEPPTPIPMPQPADGITSVKDFLISLGLTPFPDCQPAPIPSSEPNTSPTLPTQSSPPPQGLAESLAQTTTIQYHSPGSIPVTSTATSTTSQATSVPTTAAQVMPPQKVSSTDHSQRTPKTTRAKTSTERSRIQRARKRNSTKAGLQMQPQKAPANRSIAPKTDAVNKNNVSTPTQPIGQVPAPSGPAQIQFGPAQNQAPMSAPVNTPQSIAQTTFPHPTASQDIPPEDRILLADGIYVSIAQVYITAASIGHLLTADNIRSMSSEQIVNLFLHARQVAISNVANPVNAAPIINTQLNAVSQHPLGVTISPPNLSDAVPVAHAGSLAPEPSVQLASQQVEQDPLHQANVQGIPKKPAPALSDTAQATAKANTNIPEQHVDTQSASFFGMSHQDFPNLHVQHTSQNMAPQTHPPGEIQPDYTGIEHIHASAAFQSPLENRSSGQHTTPGHEKISQVQPGMAIQPPPNLAPQNGISIEPSPSYAPSSFQLVILRLQRFQQKYRVYLKLVQDNLALLTSQGIQGVERERYFRYMRYVVKLLTCPMSTANRISMEIIDKVESFLREYLVRYQGIALKRRTNPGSDVPGSSSGIGIASNFLSNMQMQLPSETSPGPAPQPAQLGISDISLARQNDTSAPEINNLMHSDVSAAVPTSAQHIHVDYRTSGQGSRNAALRAIEAQRKDLATTGIRQARAGTNTRILTGGFAGQTASLPTSNQNLDLNAQTTPGITPVSSAAENRNPVDINSQIAKRVSRLNHYVRMAVHWTNNLEKNLENESLLRIKEERIAEVCYAVDAANKKHTRGRPSRLKTDPEPCLMDIVKKECEEACKKHAKLIIGIDEEWKRPAVSCLLAFKSIRMPKMIIHVPATYRDERHVSFGFERPAFGWTGIVGDVKKKFYSIRQGGEGVCELLETWVAAAEEFLNDD